MNTALFDRSEMLTATKPLMDAYKKRINKTDEFVKATKGKGLSDFEKASMAILLDNTEKVLRRYKKMKSLSDTTFSETVGPFKRHAMNIISATYTTFDLKELISIQPLTQKIAAIYHLTYTYANNKGNIVAGSPVFSATTTPVRTGYYSSMIVNQEPVTLTLSGASDVANLQYFPLIKPEYINMVIVGGAGAGTYTLLNVVGNVANLQLNGGGVGVGTLNLLTGALTITVDILAGLTSCIITYKWNSEQASPKGGTGTNQTPTITVGVDETLITAERRQLLFEISLDATFDYDQQFGNDLNAELESTVIQEIQNETSYMVMDQLFKGATGNGATTYAFTMPAPAATNLQTVQEYAQYFWRMLSDMSMKIYNNLGRGMGNKIVCGTNFLQLTDQLPDTIWKPSGVEQGDVKGPFLAGKLLGKYDVFFNPAYANEDFIMLYKGSDWWESPYYLGIYLPLISSKFMMFPDMIGREGYLSMDAQNYMFPLHVVRGEINWA